MVTYRQFELLRLGKRGHQFIRDSSQNFNLHVVLWTSLESQLFAVVYQLLFCDHTISDIVFRLQKVLEEVIVAVIMIVIVALICVINVFGLVFAYGAHYNKPIQLI